jgi:hypothetical protein
MPTAYYLEMVIDDPSTGTADRGRKSKVASTIVFGLPLLGCCIWSGWYAVKPKIQAQKACSYSEGVAFEEIKVELGSPRRFLEPDERWGWDVVPPPSPPGTVRIANYSYGFDGCVIFLDVNDRVINSIYYFN